MGNINIESQTVERIMLEWERRGRSEKPRRYLGASVIGHDCDRYLWLHFRGLFRENFDGRMYRLFNRGQREESVFVNELRGIGCTVWDVDPDTGLQWAVSALGGHFGGHLDSVAVGVPEAPKAPHVVEFKTHSDASFRKLQKSGVKMAKPMHYAQMQVYMGAMSIDRALYLAVDKDNDELYAERVRFDSDAYGAIMARARRIITEASSNRCATRPDDYRCKSCPAADVCWHRTGQALSIVGEIDCRSCCHATADVERGGQAWTCRLGKSCVIGSACRCSQHLALPDLVDCDGVEEAGLDFIVFKFGRNLVTNGTATGQFTSEELTKIGRLPLEEGTIQQIRDAMQGRIVAQNRLEMKHRDEQEIFRGNVSELRGYLKGWGGTWALTASEEIDGVRFFEYGDVLVVVDEANDVGYVKSAEPPF